MSQAAGVVELRCFSTPRLLKKRIMGPSSASSVFRLHWGEAGAALAAGHCFMVVSRGAAVSGVGAHTEQPLSQCVLASQSLETKASLVLTSAAPLLQLLLRSSWARAWTGAIGRALGGGEHSGHGQKLFAFCPLPSQ